jgi:hypothetical protein
VAYVITPAELGPEYFREVADLLKAAAGGPPDRMKAAEIMQRYDLTPVILKTAGASPMTLDVLDLRDFAAHGVVQSESGQRGCAAFFSQDGSLHVNDDPPAVGRAAVTQVAR